MLQLWENNKGFIAKLARKFRGYIEPEDAEQEIYLALSKSVELWDPDAGTAFITYFGTAAQRHLQRVIAKQSGVSVHVYDDVRRYRQTIEEYTRTNGREPSDIEAAELMNITPEELRRIRQAESKTSPASLDAITQGEEGEEAGTIGDTIPGGEDPEAPALENEYQSELAAAMWPIVETLRPSQAETIRNRYQKGMTLKEAGEAQGVHPNQIRAQEKRALQLLKWKHGGELRPFMYEEIYSKGLKGTGPGNFARTWTSATEREALDLYLSPRKKTAEE